MKLLKAIALAAAIWLAPAAAIAQSSPGWPFGYVPTAAEWNAAFAGKADFTGSSPITAAGGTFTGKVNFASSSAGTAGMNCGSGTAPSSPVNGDIWCTSTQMFVRLNGVSVQLGGSASTLTVPGGGTGQTSFTANLPIIGNGASALAQGTVTSTNGSTLFATATGTPGNGNCAAWSNGNIVDAGVGACGGTGGSGTVTSSTAGQVAVYTAATTVAGISACTNGYYGTNAVGAGAVSCIQTFNTTLSATITALGTIASGTWQGALVGPTYGGTGVNNGSDTITLGGNFATSGAAITLTAIGATNVTLPTTGTLMNQTGTSGGVPYYNSSTTMQSSGALTANNPVIGGGAGSAPSSGTRQGNTTTFLTYSGAAPGATNNCAVFDNSGSTANIKDSGSPCGGSAGSATPVLLVTITASGTSVTDINNCGSTSSATTGCFTNSYSRYLVDIENLATASPNTNFICQIHVYNSGGTYQTTGYITPGGGATTYLPCDPGPGGRGSNTFGAPGISGSFYVYNPSASAKTMWVGAGVMTTIGTSGSPAVALPQSIGGFWNTSAVVVGFRICFSTNTSACTSSPTLTGTVKIYGLP